MYFESLEMRALMSVSAVSTQVLADRLVIQQDLLNLQSDCVEYTQKLLADVQALQAADLKQDATLAPLFKTFRTDVQTMQQQLKSDNLAESSAVLNDQSVIVTEKLQILADQGNPTKLKADKAQLVGDFIQLENDEIAGLNGRLATRQTDYVTLQADLGAIATALAGDTNASPQLVAAVQQFNADRTDALNDIEGDLAALVGARAQLVIDLTALQSQV
jgi:hypothetical protein